MILNEIEVGKDFESKRQVVKDNLGNQVILYDKHRMWCHGKISENNYGDKMYSIKIYDTSGPNILFYHDLEKLLIVKDFPQK